MNSIKAVWGFISSHLESSSTQSAMGSSSQSVMGSSSTQSIISDEDYAWCLPLIKAFNEDDLESTKMFLNLHPNALWARLNPLGESALYIVARSGNVRLVQLLLSLMPPEATELRSNGGFTALAVAAMGGIREIAEILVLKNSNLVCIKDGSNILPVVIAAFNGDEDMVHYLYSVTPINEFCPDPTNNNGANLLTHAIMSDLYDIALDLLQRYPKLAITSDNFGVTAMHVLATRPSAFPSGCRHGILQGLIYKCIPGKLRDDPHNTVNAQVHILNLVICGLRGIVLKAIKLSVPGVKKIYDRKLLHASALEVLKILCSQISILKAPQIIESQLHSAISKAINFGIVEIIVEIVKCNPFFLWCSDLNDRGMFSLAVEHRQEKIYNVLYEMGEKKVMANRRDKYGNSMLHLAAMLPPSSQMKRVSGAALQMQRELQWFKEVETIMQPRFKDLPNSDGKTPQALFTEQHKELVKEGEKWLKETSQACMVVATLIATVMFTAAFTVPGGYNGDKGVPIFIRTKAFDVFIVSDALSLFSSCTSVLMFLAILTSRYAEEDFLRSLPKRLIIGLSTLFFSIVTMMSTFGATLVIVLKEKYTWVAFPVIFMAAVPVAFFALLQLPLFIDIVFNTYGSGIFRTKIRHMY